MHGYLNKLQFYRNAISQNVARSVVALLHTGRLLRHEHGSISVYRLHMTTITPQQTAVFVPCTGIISTAPNQDIGTQRRLVCRRIVEQLSL